MLISTGSKLVKTVLLILYIIIYNIPLCDYLTKNWDWIKDCGADNKIKGAIYTQILSTLLYLMYTVYTYKKDDNPICWLLMAILLLVFQNQWLFNGYDIEDYCCAAWFTVAILPPTSVFLLYLTSFLLLGTIILILRYIIKYYDKVDELKPVLCKIGLKGVEYIPLLVLMHMEFFTINFWIGIIVNILSFFVYDKFFSCINEQYL